jgi:hypothetical protein
LFLVIRIAATLCCFYADAISTMMPCAGNVFSQQRDLSSIAFPINELANFSSCAMLLGGQCPPNITNLGTLNIGPIDWWLDWMIEMARADDPWHVDQLGALFAEHLTIDAQNEFLVRFNTQTSKFGRLLARFVLPYRSDLTTDAFNEDSTSFLLADLNRQASLGLFGGHLLGSTATEQFVVERLIPLVADAKPPLSENLRLVLNQAGRRHGRRYSA